MYACKHVRTHAALACWVFVSTHYMCLCVCVCTHECVWVTKHMHIDKHTLFWPCILCADKYVTELFLFDETCVCMCKCWYTCLSIVYIYIHIYIYMSLSLSASLSPSLSLSLFFSLSLSFVCPIVMCCDHEGGCPMISGGVSGSILSRMRPTISIPSCHIRCFAHMCFIHVYMFTCSNWKPAQKSWHSRCKLGRWQQLFASFVTTRVVLAVTVHGPSNWVDVNIGLTTPRNSNIP